MGEKKVETVKYYDQEAISWSASHGGDDKESWWKDERDVLELIRKYILEIY